MNIGNTESIARYGFPEMKTITLKADEAFDALLSQLAAKLETTRSAVIRDAVISYERHLQMDALRRQVREASRRTRSQAEQAEDDLGPANDDGL
jgi:predicted transcriptional regulator